MSIFKRNPFLENRLHLINRCFYFYHTFKETTNKIKITSFDISKPFWETTIDYISEDVDFEILDSDLKIDTYRASGAGGQHINKTESAIRITHIPTGIVVACQTQRSQIQNREVAMNMLKSKLYELYESQRQKEQKDKRHSQVGTGDRSERVRTYNYPQGRVTDHRVNVSSFDLEGVLNGDIDIFIDALILKDRTEQLESGEE